MQDAPDEDEFVSGSGLYQDAVVRNIEIIGEAAKHLPENFTSIYPQVPWRSIVGMRNKITHEYSIVDWPEVWRVATKDVGELRGILADVLAKEQKLASKI